MSRVRSTFGVASGALLALIPGLVFSNPIHDQTAALPEEKRQVVFARQMQRSGETCPSVTRTVFQGQAKDGSAFWSLCCAGGKDWQLSLPPSAAGQIRYLDCKMIKALKGAACFSKFR